LSQEGVLLICIFCWHLCSNFLQALSPSPSNCIQTTSLSLVSTL
jgi:hypothetical protein